MSWLSSLLGFRRSWKRHPHAARHRRPWRGAALARLHLEGLETRCLLSATLVKDLNTAVGSSSLLPEFTDVKGTTFFLADDGVHGRELWKTDGTPTGAHLVKDIYRGAGNAFNVFPAGLTNVNGTLFFPANDGIHGLGLWKSDGTAAGTVLVKAFPNGTQFFDLFNLINVNGTLFFSIQTGPADNQGLWKSDGTPDGTVKVSDVIPFQNGAKVSMNGTLFFLGSDTAHGSGFWKSDGTVAGTVFLKGIEEEEGAPEMVNVNGTIFFDAAPNDGSGSQELWKSDGTAAGTVPVDESDLAFTYPSNLTNVHGTLFFEATGNHVPNQLWKTDGTDAGTSLVKIIPIQMGVGGGLSSFVAAKKMLFFIATGTGGADTSQLWVSDGTAAGTMSIKDNPGLASLVKVHGTVFFAINDVSTGPDLWKTNGTVEGTVLVKHFNSSDRRGLQDLTNVHGTLFFSADDGVHGREVWKSDGTTAGTVLVKDIFPGNQSSNFSALVSLHGSVYFMLASQSNAGLWTSDGTSDGTVQVSTVVGFNLTVAGGTTLFFSGPDTRGRGRALWESDGTTAGTFRVQDLGFGSEAQNLTDATDPLGNLKLFFTFDTQLWVSDGTPDGTVELLLASGAPANLTNVNGTLFFTLDDGTRGRELWESDGTRAGTVLVKDINVGGASSNPQSLTNVGGTLYFSADDGVHGRQLWKSDGTPTGTVLAADINPGGSSNPTDLTVSNGFLYFAAATPATGRELWQYDPNSGTASVFDIKPGMGSSNPSNLTDVNGELFFAANDGVDGQELWATDGTQAGTYLVADILPGKAGSKPEYLYAWNGILYFTANDGVHGRELWQSDGTAAGTVLVQDINPGKGSAFHSFYNPEFTVVGNQLFFVADDRIHGRELWVYTPDNAPTARHHDRLALSATVVADHRAAAVAMNRSARLSATGVAVPATLPSSSGAEDRSLVELSMVGLGESGGSQALPARLSARNQPTTAWGADLVEPDDRLLDEVFRTLAEK